MSSVKQDFIANLDSVSRAYVPRPHKVVVWVIVILLAVIIPVLMFVPWIQTAFGSGSVSTLNPDNRAQPISALVPGQIKTWHVREGDVIKAGAPIVTLIDVDEGRINKLTAQLEATKQRHKANLAAVANSQINLNRQRELASEGLVSPREVEFAEIRLQELSAQAKKTEEDINKVKMDLARQSTQTKVAPQDGTITRLLSAGVSTYINAGDVLGWFIPSKAERSVTVKVSGLDAALITPKRKVRIQFEGWPIFQLSGWPGTSVGTFGGIVDYIDPVADVNGQFTVWIKPDPNDAPWPDENSARLGSRARAWVLLEEVSLGYELWRQLNNFPPNKTTMSADE
jgi:multidrug efflux pump subunit AcrA (membrane-fusion protein)